MATHWKLPRTAKAKITKNSTYRSVCPPWEGKKFHTRKYPWTNQVHHIVCEHSIGDVDKKRIGAEQFDFLRNCLKITNWRINDAENLVGLPLKSVYFGSDGETPVNLCAHNVDHPKYTQECKEWLHKHVWNTLQAKKKGHDVEPKDIKAELKKCTAAFKTKLKNRGRRNGGTRRSWKNRHKPSEKLTWYLPFSMAKKPTKRAPGGSGLKRFQIL